MKLLSGQKTLCVFLVLVLTAICMALFLDNSSGDKHYIALCLVLFATDAACFGIIFYRIFADIRGQQGQAHEIGLRALLRVLNPFNTVYTGQFVCVTCKVIFEVLLAVKFTFAVSIPYIMFFIPFWIFCGIIFFDLTRRLYSIQQKVNQH